MLFKPSSQGVLAVVAAALLLVAAVSAQDTAAADFFTLVETACPAGTLSGINATDLYESRDKVSCEYYPDSDPYNVTVLSGDDLTSLPEGVAARLNCEAAVPSYPFACCGVVSEDGTVSNGGRTCAPPTKGDAAPSPLSAAAWLTATALAAVALWTTAA